MSAGVDIIIRIQMMMMVIMMMMVLLLLLLLLLFQMMMIIIVTARGGCFAAQVQTNRLCPGPRHSELDPIVGKSKMGRRERRK